MAAAITTINIYQNENVIDFLYQQGQRLADGINKSVAEIGLKNYFGVMDRASNLVYFTHDENSKPSQLFRTLFLQETIRRGLILPSLIVSYSHKNEDIDRTIEIIHEALITYKNALNDGIEKYLHGRSVQPVFRKKN